MAFWTFLLKVVIVSLSGVMAPGPMTAVAVADGTKSPNSGVFIAIGHGIIEIPLMILIFYGIGFINDVPLFKPIISLIGGIVLLAMAYGMFKSSKIVEEDQKTSHRSSLWSGILLSLYNPYFILWWLMVGAVLILDAAKFGIWGFVAFAFVHWSCDLVWYYILSSMSYKGGRFFGANFQKIVFIFCGIFLMIFSGMYIFDSVKYFLN